MNPRAVKAISTLCIVTLALAGVMLSAPPAGSSTRQTKVDAHSTALNQLSPGDHTITVTVGTRTRTYILHVPPNPPVARRPLILVFHGADDTAANTIQETDFEQVADQDGELVAFLQGFNDTWNEGAGDSAAALAHINDVAFTLATINSIEGLVTFNHARIAATGFSNGALMVEDLGCRLAQKLALIVPVEGQLPVSVSKTCAPARPISVYEIHGTGDTAIPYGGGPFVGVAGGTTVLSAPGSVARWAHLDGCTRSAVTTPSSGVKLTSYSHCRNGAKVTLETLIGGVHQWAQYMGETVNQAWPS